MKSTIKVISLLLLIVVLLSYMSSFVFAEKVGEPVPTQGVDMGVIFEGMKEYTTSKIRVVDNKLVVKSKGVEYVILSYDSSYLYAYAEAIESVKNKDITKAFGIFTKSLIDNIELDNTRQQILHDLENIDGRLMMKTLLEESDKIKPNLSAAMIYMSPVLTVVSYVLGFVSIGLIIFLILTTVCDLAYIGLPLYREWRSGENGHKKSWLVSYEALDAVKQVEEACIHGQCAYQNVYFLYFKHRALTYIVLAICIMYLICGGISGIISFVLGLVSGFMPA